jgi:hypothetical protein
MSKSCEPAIVPDEALLIRLAGYLIQSCVAANSWNRLRLPHRRIASVAPALRQMTQPPQLDSRGIVPREPVRKCRVEVRTARKGRVEVRTA